MGSSRSEEQVKVGELLAKARSALGLSLSFLGQMDGETQTFEVVETSIPFFRDGQSQPQKGSFCQAVLDGELPNVIPNVAKMPKAKALPPARWPRIRSYVGVPVVLSDGSIYGTFCAVGFTADNELSARDQVLMEVLADATATVIEPVILEQRRNAEIRSRLDPLMNAGGPRVLVQPIVSLVDGALIGAEALSRFPEGWAKAPDTVFAEAELVGAGTTLQLLAVQQASRHLDRVNGYVSVNLSPHTLEDPRSLELLAGFPADRIVLELSEHEQVEEYDAMRDALAPLRGAGIRLAIDDVGAGYSSLRHIMLTRPDIIKLDRSIIDGVSTDPVQQTLIHSLVEFGHASGAEVVAEGIETLDDMRVLRDLGIDAGQGWYFGRAEEPEQLRSRYRPFAGGEAAQPTEPDDSVDPVGAVGPSGRRPRAATKAAVQQR